MVCGLLARFSPHFPWFALEFLVNSNSCVRVYNLTEGNHEDEGIYFEQFPSKLIDYTNGVCCPLTPFMCERAEPNHKQRENLGTKIIWRSATG